MYIRIYNYNKTTIQYINVTCGQTVRRKQKLEHILKIKYKEHTMWTSI